MVKHFLQFKDLTREELEYLFARTRVIKDRFKRYEKYHPLVDRTLAMIFEKSSTRTRLSFEAGMHQLGGAAIYLNTRDTQLGRGEPVEDAAEVISRKVIRIAAAVHAASRSPTASGSTASAFRVESRPAATAARSSGRLFSSRASRSHWNIVDGGTPIRSRA